jgi:hypothetical protein
LKQTNKNTQTYIPKCVKEDDALNSTNIDELETITTFQAHIIQCKMKQQCIKIQSSMINLVTKNLQIEPFVFASQ